VVSSYAVSNDDLVAGTVPRGAGSVDVVDGSSGSIEYRLHVASGSSASSPLVARSTRGVAAVLCVCATSRDTADDKDSVSTGFGFWTPGRPGVEDLGLPSSLLTTPAFVPNNDGFDLVSIGDAPSTSGGTAAVLSSVPVRLGGSRVTSVPWGGYMGTAGDGYGGDG